MSPTSPAVRTLQLNPRTSIPVNSLQTWSSSALTELRYLSGIPTTTSIWECEAKYRVRFRNNRNVPPHIQQEELNLFS